MVSHAVLSQLDAVRNREETEVHKNDVFVLPKELDEKLCETPCLRHSVKVEGLFKGAHVLCERPENTKFGKT